MQTPITNSIICGDCRDKARQYIPAEFVDLIYLDPPFFSGKNYDLIWEGDNKNTIRSFEDTKFYKKVCGNPECKKDFPEGFLFCPQCGTSVDKAKDVRMNDIDAYVGWLKVRLQECYRVLKPTGSIYVHLDWHAVHYVKVEMDKIFNIYGNDNKKVTGHFRNEIIWFYPDSPGRPKRDFPRKHDTILRYTKTADYTFNDQAVRVEILDASKERYRTPRKLGGRSYTGGDAVKNGKIPEDVWRLPVVKGNSKERMGYPTQKPEALLDRIIKASSNPGDLLLDPFCGCGTALAVAQKLGRRWIGIDAEMPACVVVRQRLDRLGHCPVIIDATESMTEAKLRDIKPALFQEWAVRAVGGTMNRKLSGDGGIDGWTMIVLDPIQVKRSDSVGVKVVREFQTVIQDDNRRGGIIIAFSYTKGAIDKAKNAKDKYGINIELKTVKELLQ